MQRPYIRRQGNGRWGNPTGSIEPQPPILRAGRFSALGRAAFEQKRYPEAIDLLQRATASDDSLREAHYYLGLTFARLGRQKEADSELQIATRLEHEEAQHRRTVLRIQDGQGDQHANSDPKE